MKLQKNEERNYDFSINTCKDTPYSLSKWFNILKIAEILPGDLE